MFIDYCVVRRIRLLREPSCLHSHRPYVVFVHDYEHSLELLVGLRAPGPTFMHSEYGLLKPCSWIMMVAEDLEKIATLPWLSEVETIGEWSEPEIYLHIIPEVTVP